MYVQHSVHIKRSVKVVSAILLEGPSQWFPGLDENNVSTVGLHVAGVPVRKKVAVEIGQPVKTSTWALRPITWKATFPVRLFPEMSGKIELTASGKDETRLTVSGMYEPPLGKLGGQLDEAVMHNIAEGTVKELAESIAQRLEKAAKA